MAILKHRDAIPTTVELCDGRVLLVYNIAWGQDIGDAEYHVTTNISPSLDGATIDLFWTHEVLRIFDPMSGQVLLQV